MFKTTQDATVKRRFRRVFVFLRRVILSVFIWDILIPRLRLHFLRKDPKKRWQRLAREFRELAEKEGALLIKLGQFLSTRVDILPVEVTSELQKLQDELPPAPFEEIKKIITEEFGKERFEQLFSKIDPKVLGSASLAQVHKAYLKNGETVVVKVLRPRIEELVTTDLAAIKKALNYLKKWKFLTKRVNIDKLYNEFETTSLKELNLIEKAKNLLKFKELFKDNPKVKIPDVDRIRTRKKVLTLEYVEGIKIDDIEQLEKTNVDLYEVAKLFQSLLLEQLFIHRFVHADPHPGNILIQVDNSASNKFKIVYLDFGMMAHIPKHIYKAMVMYLQGLAYKDARLIVSAYLEANIVLPGTDIPSLIRAHQLLLDKVWGISVIELSSISFSMINELFREYRELMLSMPLQYPTDLLYAWRAVGIVAGLTVKLAPNFNPWNELIPYAKMTANVDPLETWENLKEELYFSMLHGWKIPRKAYNFFKEWELINKSKPVTLHEINRKIESIENNISKLNLYLISLILLSLSLFLDNYPTLETTLTTLALVIILKTVLKNLNVFN